MDIFAQLGIVQKKMYQVKAVVTIWFNCINTDNKISFPIQNF